MSEMQRDCYDVIAGLDESVRGVIGETNYYVLGGVATNAITHPDTKFDHDSRTIITSDGLEYSSVRQENGTLRDVDVLVMHVLDKHSAGLAHFAVNKVVQNQLKVSVFGLDEHQPNTGRLDRFRAGFKDWLSRRTIDEKGIVRQELFPLSRELPSDSFSPWSLKLPRSDEKVDVLNPVGHMLAYKMRSVSGPRYKDRSKIKDMEEVIYGDEHFRDDLNFGPFKPWQEFADAIKSLRNHRPYEVWDGIIDDRANSAEIALFGLKSRLLSYGESQERLIEWAQSDKGEKLLKPFVRQH